MRIKTKTEIGLGTVQLGLPYGPNAKLGLMPELEAHSILDFAYQSGIRFFDTAIEYGEAETRLGKHTFDEKNSIEIASKIPSVGLEIYSSPEKYWNFILSEIKGSLQRLRISKFPLLQFHQCDPQFLESVAFRKSVERLLNEGVAEKVGVSVYAPHEGILAAQIKGVSALQFPVNLLDQRFLEPTVFSKIKSLRLIARSVFFQGLLIDEAPIPSVAVSEELKILKNKALSIAKHLQGSLQALAMAFVFHEVKGLSQGIIGVDSVGMLRRNLEIYSQVDKVGFIGKAFRALAEEAKGKNLIEPRSWNKKPSNS